MGAEAAATAETGAGASPHVRRYDYDVTNTVQVSSVAAVRDAVQDLFIKVWPDICFDEVWLAFHDFERLFTGQLPGYAGCDTVYHDIQHSLDVTLAMARLTAGYELSVNESDRFGPDRAAMGIICALFHDAGYILDSTDQEHRNGAELTKSHITRGGEWLRRWMPRVGMARLAPAAAEVLHFTGYEKPLDAIQLSSTRDYLLGSFLGTSDYIAQMADRCYLEKCRDRLYPEFVLAGIAIEADVDGKREVKYQSGTDLLLQTPDFYRNVVRKRLDNDFNKAYRYVEALFEGRNPYIEFIERNMAYLEYIIETGQWPLVRRTPPCFTVKPEPLAEVNVLVNETIRRLRGGPVTLGNA